MAIDLHNYRIEEYSGWVTITEIDSKHEVVIETPRFENSIEALFITKRLEDCLERGKKQ